MAVASSLPDTSPGNDTVSTSFTVQRAAAKVSCVVPALAGLRLSTAERLLKLTNCRTGKVRRRHSRTVRSGRVVSSSPRALSRRAKNAKVGLVVSSGPPPKKRRAKKRG